MFPLGKEDFISIGKGALIAAAGAVIVFLGEKLATYNFGDFTPVVVALAAVLVNIGRKLFDGKRE